MYYILNPDRRGDPIGPYTQSQLETMLRDRIITKWHFIAKDGDSEWVMMDVAFGKTQPHRQEILISGNPSVQTNLAYKICRLLGTLLRPSWAPKWLCMPVIGIAPVVTVIAIGGWWGVSKNGGNANFYSEGKNEAILTDLDFKEFASMLSQGKYGNDKTMVSPGFYSLNSILYLRLHGEMIAKNETDKELMTRTALLALFCTIQSNALMESDSVPSEGKALITEAVTKGFGSPDALANAYLAARNEVKPLSHDQILASAKVFCRAAVDANFLVPIKATPLAEKCQ